MQLSQVYKTQSGKSLYEAKPEEFILRPDGTVKFGEISQKVADATNGELVPGEIRVLVGNESRGMIHDKKHESQIKDAGYDSAEAFIEDTLKDFDEIYKRVPELPKVKVPYTVAKRKADKNGVVSIGLALEKGEDGNYYAVITSMPKSNRKLEKGKKRNLGL